MGPVLTCLHRGGHRLEQFRVTLAEVGGAQHADEIDDFLAISILQYRVLAALDEDRKRKDSSRGMLAINLQELLRLGGQSHDLALSLIFPGHDCRTSGITDETIYRNS